MELANKWRFDLIISDWNMEPMNGLELLREIRKQPSTRYTPFILITASLSEEAWKGAIKLDATEFLLKPVQLNTLRAACKLCLSLNESNPPNVISLRERLRQRQRPSLEQNASGE